MRRHEKQYLRSNSKSGVILLFAVVVCCDGVKIYKEYSLGVVVLYGIVGNDAPDI